MKVKTKFLINIFILMILVKPMIVEYLPSVNKIYYVLKVVVAAYILCRYILNGRISKFTITIIIYNLFLIFSTILNSGDVVKLLGVVINTVSLVIFTEIMIYTDVDEMFKSYIKLLDIYLIINTITILLFPNGMIRSLKEAVYFLGNDNRFIFFYLPLICFRFCYSYYKYNKLQKMDYIVYLVCLLTLVYKWSVGAMVGLILYIPFVMLLANNNRISKIANLFNYMIVVLVSNYLIVIKQIQFYFENFIVNVLHKDPTLSYRTVIWNKALQWIYQKPIFGNGYESDSVVKEKLIGANHPHNYILTILYRGGIIYFLIFLFLFYLAGKKMKSYQESKITKTIAFTIFSAFIMCLLDSFDFAMFFIIIELGYFIEKFIKKDVKE